MFVNLKPLKKRIESLLCTLMRFSSRTKKKSLQILKNIKQQEMPFRRLQLNKYFTDLP